MANSVINEILRQGRNRPRRQVLAALTTGRVESNFRNLSGGHADSQGWRQERASLYRNPRNLRASVRRFYQEAAQHDRGQGVGELAADVQRPAAQYRGRYADVLPEAKRLLRTRGAGVGGSGGGGATRWGSASLRLAPGKAPNLAALLSELVPERQRPAVTPPAALASSAQAPMPAGYQPIETTGSQARTDYASAIERLASLNQRGSLANAIEVAGGTIRGGGGRRGESGTGEVHELFWNGPGATNIDEGKRVAKGFVSGHTDHVHLAADRGTMKRAARTARSMGLSVGEYGRGIRSGHAEGSFHYKPFGAMDVSGDTAKMRRFAKRVARGRI
jgi:hypothetical protein